MLDVIPCIVLYYTSPNFVCIVLRIAIHISVAIHIVVSAVASTIGICNPQNRDICKSLTLNMEQQEI